MPGIGIGVSTPFSQPSNYQTVLNHRYRDETPYDPSKQLKIKCPYCGVWARKGRECSLCGTAVPGHAPQQRSKSPSATSSSRQGHSASRQRPLDHTTSTPGRTGKPTTPKRTSTWEASIPAMSPGSSYYASREQLGQPQRGAQSPGQSFRSTTTPLRHGPDQQVRKVKCSYCGIWVPAGKICSLCRTQS